MWRNTSRAGSETDGQTVRLTDRESHALWGGLNHLHGGSSSTFLPANHLALSGLESTFGPTQGLALCVRMHLLPKMESSASVSGRLTGYIRMCYESGTPPPAFSDPEESLCLCSLGGLLEVKNEKYVYRLYKQDSAPPCSCHNLYLEVSVHKRQ